MSSLFSSQLYIFLIYCLCGIIIGIFFDIFRILRKSFKTPDIITYIQDIIFDFNRNTLLFIIFKFNNGEIRSYIFIGLGLGIIIYLLIFSKIFIKVNTTIIKYLKIIIYKIFIILTFPLKIIKNIFDKIILKI